MPRGDGSGPSGQRGSACFSPPWYFHHASLPEKPQMDAVAWVRAQTTLPLIVAGGGPAGLSAALYLSARGHAVTLAEKENRLGGQFNLAWQAPGKQSMQDGLDNLKYCAKANADSILTGRAVDLDLINEFQPDLLVWATGAVQNIPRIEGLQAQNTMTAIEYFKGDKAVQGPRVLVIGAGRSGLEIAEKLGKQGFDVVATKRTDPIGSMMEMITQKLTLMRIDQLPNVTLMPHTTVMSFGKDGAKMEKDGEMISLERFQTVILASGMLPAPGPDAKIREAVPNFEIIGDAESVMDIYAAVHAGYEAALKY